jgi:hypothetical protein
VGRSLNSTKERSNNLPQPGDFVFKSLSSEKYYGKKFLRSARIGYGSLVSSSKENNMNKNLRLVFPEDEKDTILIMDGDKVVKEVHHEMLRQMLQLSESYPDSKIGHAIFAQILAMPDTKIDPSSMGRLLRFGPPPRP